MIVWWLILIVFSWVLWLLFIGVFWRLLLGFVRCMVWKRIIFGFSG